MKQYPLRAKGWSILKRSCVAPKYKGVLALAVLFNIFSALLNLVAFALVMPILNILFQIEARVTTFIPWSSLDLTTQQGWADIPKTISHNSSYIVSVLIAT